MGRTSARIDVPGLVSDAEALWYDHGRWPTFIDGFKHLDKVEGDWPRRGATVVLELEWRLKQQRPFMPLVDLLFIRRQQRDALMRTLRRFRTELAAESEDDLTG